MTSPAEHYRERRRCLQVLNLSESASEAEIKASYKSLARQWHPDKNSAADATEKMQEITAAYNYLLKGHSVLEDDDDDDDLMSAYMHLFPWLFSHFYRGSSSGYRFFFSSDPFGYEDSSDDDYVSQPKPRGHPAHRANQYHARNSDRRGSPHTHKQRKTSEPKTAVPDPGLAGDKAARRREKKLRQKQRKKEEKAAAQAERAADRHTWQQARSRDTSREATPASVPDQDVPGSNPKSDHASTVPATNGSQVPASQHRSTVQQAQSEEKKVTKEMPPHTAKDEKSANSGTSASNHSTAPAAPASNHSTAPAAPASNHSTAPAAPASNHSTAPAAPASNHSAAPAAPARKTKQQLKEEQRRREEEIAQIAKELQEKMEQEREKKAKKQAAKEERERQEAEERRRQEEEEIQAEARRIREMEQRREEEMLRKQQEEEEKRQLARLLEDFDSGLYIDLSGDFVTTDTTGVGNIKRPPASYTAAGYQGFGDDDESAAHQDNQYQAYEDRGRSHGFPSPPPRGLSRPVAEGLRHPPPQQFFPDHPPPHMWNAPGSSMGHRQPASHNVRGGFQGSGVPPGRDRGSERGGSDAGHAAIHAESKREDLAQQPPGYGQAVSEHIAPSQARDSPRFPDDSAQRQSEFIVHNSQFATQGNNSYQPSSAVPPSRAVPPPHFGQGFPLSPPRPLLQPQALLGRQVPPATFLNMPPAFVPVQPLFNTSLSRGPPISASHLGPTLPPGLTPPQGVTMLRGLAPLWAPTLPPGLAPPQGPALTTGLVPPPSAVPLPNFSMPAAEHRPPAHRPPPLAPAFNAAHTTAADQTKSSVSTHTATADQTKSSVSTHTATVGQARPSVSTHTATVGQARPSVSTHNATAGQARPSDKIQAVTSNTRTVAASQAVPSNSAKTVAANLSGYGDSTRSINQPRPDGYARTDTADQAKRASGSSEQTRRASGTGEQAHRVSDSGDEAGKIHVEKAVRGSSLMTNGNAVPPFLVPPLLTPTGPRPQRPYIPPFGSMPIKTPVPSKPSHLPPKPSTSSASLAASATGPHGSEKLTAMARVGEKLVSTGSVGSADSSSIPGRQPKLASVATNKPQVQLMDGGTHSSKSVFGLDDID